MISSSKINSQQCTITWDEQDLGTYGPYHFFALSKEYDYAFNYLDGQIDKQSLVIYMQSIWAYDLSHKFLSIQNEIVVLILVHI
jgi:hypothetical protein